MTAAVFPHVSTLTSPVQAGFMHPVTADETTADAFYRDAADALRYVVMGLDETAPSAVSSDPAWRTAVALVEGAGASDAARASMLLALTCVLDSALAMEAMDKSTRQRAA